MRPPTDCTMAELIQRARRLAEAGGRRILGITGSPGAGKSTLATQLVTELGPEIAVLVPMDGFHLSNSVLEALGRRDRKGAHDTFDDAGYAALLGRLHRSSTGRESLVYAPEFRREIEESVGSAIPVSASVPLVVTEGNYLLLDRGSWPQARALVDETWFLAPPEDIRVSRLIARHQAYGKEPEQARLWALGTDQRNAELIEFTAVRADLVVRLLDGGGPAG
jgi:pantothenate kinase